MDNFSELHRDVLVEVINLGMGQAASSLSQMVEEEILLSVPDLSFLSSKEAGTILSHQASSTLTGVSQEFSGSFYGHAMLLFPEKSSLELVRLLLQDSVPLDNLTEFEEEALNEVGNIILNAGLSSLANMFDQEILTELPIFKQGSANELLNANHTESGNENLVLFLRVDFKLEKHAIDGYVIFLLNVKSMQSLMQLIDNYLTEMSC